MIVSAHSEVEALREAVYANAEAAMAAVKHFSAEDNGIQFFSRMKFEQIGRNPVSGNGMNLIEQINQTCSALVVLAGVDDLLRQYPDKKFSVQLGATAGCDIESEDGEIAAECFAVTTIDSNSKLRKDSKKLMKMQGPKYRYIYFYAHCDSDEKLFRQYKRYPDIRFLRITEL